jgi:hypothetical protein
LETTSSEGIFGKYRLYYPFSGKNRIFGKTALYIMDLRKYLIPFCLILLSFAGISQNRDAEQVLEEGKHLYRLEKAAWLSTDHLKEHFSGKWEGLKGYVSYEEKGEVITLFYQEGLQARVLVRYHFSFQPAPQLEKVDTLNQLPTFYEEELIRLRERAIYEVYEKGDGFAFYENTSFNFIPLIQNGKKQVYILTGPQVPDIVILGNDYLLTFNKKNKLKSRKKLHNSIITLPYTGEEADETIEQTYHTHVISDLIDVTDVCTLLLYKDYVDWKQHTVIGKKYVSFFNLEEETLAVLKRKAWDRIMDMEK